MSLLLNDRNKAHIAKIIEEETGWMIGWSVSEETRDREYAKASMRVASYVQRLHRQRIKSLSQPTTDTSEEKAE